MPRFQASSITISRKDMIKFGPGAFLFMGTMIATFSTLMVWRIAPANADLGWPEREYSLWAITDKKMGIEALENVTSSLCASYRVGELQTRGTARKEVIKLITDDGGLKGISQACSYVEDCFDHMGLRCYFYEDLMEAGPRTTYFLYCSLVMTAITTGLQFFWVTKRWHRLIVFLFAFASEGISMAGVIWWLYASDDFLNTMRTQTLWPYAECTLGVWIAVLGLSLGGVGVCMLLWNLFKAPDEGEVVADEEEEGEFEGEDNEEPFLDGEDGEDK